jgi:hypothetical protein
VSGVETALQPAKSTGESIAKKTKGDKVSITFFISCYIFKVE